MGVNFGGFAGPSDEEHARALNDMYSQQPYQIGQASGYCGSPLLQALGALGSVGATAYGYFQGFSGMGAQQYNAQMQEMQSALGTPIVPEKKKRKDPEEVAWLKGRIREVVWRG